MSISIVIVTYKRKKEVIELLESLSVQTLLPNEIILVNNLFEGSQEFKQILLREVPERIRRRIKYVENSHNSLTVGRNLGVSISNSEYICLLDDDVEIDPRYLEKASLILQTNSSIVGLQGRIIRKPKLFRNVIGFLTQGFSLTRGKAKVKKSIAGSYNWNPGNSELIDCEWISGSNQFYRKSVLETVTWDENLIEYCDGEDIDHSFRVGQTYPGGLKMCTNLIVRHKISQVGRSSNFKSIFMRDVYGYYLCGKLFNNSRIAFMSFWFNRICLLFMLWTKSLFRGSLSQAHIYIKIHLKTWLFIFKNSRDLRNHDLTIANAALKHLS